MTRYAIIVAGGSGTRFGSEMPKQYLPLAGKTVIMQTILNFAAVPDTKIIVVISEAARTLWHHLCQEHHFSVEHTLVNGGSSRFESVKNALATIHPCPGDLIAVHDAVRPLIGPAHIERIYNEAARFGSAIPVVNVTDSIRQVNDDGISTALTRSSLRAVQTPQTFNAKALINAYDVPYADSFTDDASVFEHAGNSVHLVDGDVNNLKITHPHDLIIAEFLLTDESAAEI